MAWADRFCRADAAGSGDGTTDTNSGANGAWTLAEAITNEAAGMRINIKAGTYANTTTNRTFAGIGTTTAPIWLRGFKATAGDQDTNNVAVAGTDIPSITFSTASLSTSGAFKIISNIDITSARTTGPVWSPSGANCIYYRVRASNTGNNANSSGITNTGLGSTFIGCYFSVAQSTATWCITNAGSAQYIGCYVKGGVIGTTNTTQVVNHLYNIFDSQQGNAVQFSTGSGDFIGNTIYAPLGHGIVWTGVPAASSLIANNYFEAVNQSGKFAINASSGANTSFLRLVANTYFNCAGTLNGIQENFTIFDNGTLGTSGLVAPASQNFAATTALKALGFPGLFENTSVYQGYLDGGAVQRQEPSGSGGHSVTLGSPGILVS